MSDESSEWMRLLRDLFGDRADEAVEEMRRMGMDPESLAAASGAGSTPGMMDHVLGQMRGLMAQANGEPVNWELARQVARGVAAQGGDPTITSAVAAEYRTSVTSAELWLDATTDFDPSTATAHVWSGAEWVEATLPRWRQLAGPVATSVGNALGGLLASEAGDGAEAAVVGQVSPTVCGMQVGQAAGAMAVEAFGGTDLGVPLVDGPTVVLLPRAISAFAKDVEIPEKDVRAFLALRECAHVRLFRQAPWIAGQLHAAIERYAAGVTIDPESLDEAVRSVGIANPAAIQKALTRGIFGSSHSTAQADTLAWIENVLALIEGWVEYVVTVAGAPHIPAIGQLTELMRRRRAAGGPAEDTFAGLLGLELRPRRAREAASMWATLTTMLGPAGRDDIWSHPDLLPSGDDLDHWKDWIQLRGSDADIDAELEKILGTEGDTRDTESPA